MTMLRRQCVLMCAAAILSAADGSAQQWVSIGPSPLIVNGQPNSGRVSSIAVDPRSPTHWLIGAGNGGVWETRDAGGTWQPLTDGAPTLAIGAVAFAPANPDIVYAATGEAVLSGFARAGLGLLKSVDGGSSWALLAEATFARASVRRLRVHPTDASVLVATTSRGGFGRDSQEGPPSPPPFGVLRSTDGGISWARTLAGQATGLEIDTGNFSNQYAAIGEIRVPNGIRRDSLGAMPNGVYRSTDGGQTWTVVGGPWGESTPERAAMGRIELAMSPSNPNVVYASMAAAPNGGSSAQPLLGLYRTDDAWAPTPTWIRIPTEATGQGGYCGPEKCNYVNVISVDPLDPNTLFAGGGERGGGIFRCRPCNVSPGWTNVSSGRGVHPDHHALAWAGNRLIDGNDGGVWSTIDAGQSFQNHNAGLETAMFFSGALHPNNAEFILGGLRDHPIATRSASNAWQVRNQPAGREWGEAEVAISSQRPDTDWMAAWIWGAITRTTDGGKTGIPADDGIDKTGAAFVAPVRKCPANDNVFLTGTNRLWRSDNFFNSSRPGWAPNSPIHPYQFPNAAGAPGTIRTIEFIASDKTCNSYVFGNTGGEVRLTRDGGQTWIDLDPRRNLPSRPVNALSFAPEDPNVLYAAVSSFDIATPGKPGHVFKTTNALSDSPSWTNVTPPIDVPFNVVLVDPRAADVIYAGSDTGLWRSVDSGVSWQRMGPDTGLPHAPIHDVQIAPGTGQTVVFTYGRGAYRLIEPASQGQRQR